MSMIDIGSKKSSTARQALLYGLLFVIICISYALLVSGLSLIVLGYVQINHLIVNAIAIFGIAIIFIPLREKLIQFLNLRFFHGDEVVENRIRQFGDELTKAVGVAGIVKLIRKNIKELFEPSIIHIYLYDPLNEFYYAMPDDSGDPTSDIRFLPSSPIVNHLRMKETRVSQFDLAHLPENLETEQTKIKILDAKYYFPLPGQEHLSGWITIGGRISTDSYTKKEIDFLESLCAQAALAIERAQVINNLEDRVREMNVLTRVSQGINITLELDDILELISAQTSQIIPADDFNIYLLDDDKSGLIDIFHIENNERLKESENKPLGVDGLEMEIIRQRKPILMDNFSRQCKAKGIANIRDNIFAWMGIPLNAGAEIIGVISLSNRDQGVTYTLEQQHLLQAVADQAAGAIVKTRLLQESQRKTRQLAVLNEVSRQLTSTLDLEPLLRNILQSATSILNCEAGSLLMIDEETDELVFRVTVGPVAENMINKRIPSGTGLVGKSFKTRQPVLVNDVQASPDWFSKSDEETGFTTHALLVVPLIMQEKMLGVIEVINKLDRLPFSKDDQELLTAFAAQAVVAIQNAKLYTMTDQALGAKVEELSILQRIGRELNASLDTTRTLQITLDWALRQSGASAGFAGLLLEEGIRILANSGYENELAGYQEDLMPMEKIKIQSVIDDGSPHWFPIEEAGRKVFLTGGHGQLIVPIRRETKTIGIIVLENIPAFKVNDDILNFLGRLSDQSSIAVSNGQLYAEIKSANLAKSEFVSFVSHELKNPMTSIKGYSELLAAGAVGPINDAQSNFLMTIRSNVDRMATLVSDLADVSRIEAGRLKLDFKAQNSKEVIDEVIRSLRRQLDEKGQKVVVQLSDDLPPVWADRTRLSQVITNLVSNAYKYGDQGAEILVGAEKTDNRWIPDGPAQMVHYYVKDKGIGISEEDQKKIFQKFFRSEDPKTREAPGTGLGLNITKSLIEHQGGTIWFESEYRVGTTFHFVLPVAE